MALRDTLRFVYELMGGEMLELVLLHNEPLTQPIRPMNKRIFIIYFTAD